MSEETAIAALMDDLRGRIVKALGLGEIEADGLAADGPLFGGDGGLDSIDMLELVVMIERDFGVVITGQDAGQAFGTLRSLATFVRGRQATSAAR